MPVVGLLRASQEHGPSAHLSHRDDPVSPLEPATLRPNLSRYAKPTPACFFANSAHSLWDFVAECRHRKSPDPHRARDRTHVLDHIGHRSASRRSGKLRAGGPPPMPKNGHINGLEANALGNFACSDIVNKWLQTSRNHSICCGVFAGRIHASSLI